MVMAHEDIGDAIRPAEGNAVRFFDVTAESPGWLRR